jgi:hypothetical protein
MSGVLKLRVRKPKCQRLKAGESSPVVKLQILFFIRNSQIPSTVECVGDILQTVLLLAGRMRIAFIMQESITQSSEKEILSLVV